HPVQNKLTKKQSRLLPVPTITNDSAFDLQLSITNHARKFCPSAKVKKFTTILYVIIYESEKNHNNYLALIFMQRKPCLW
ncbi:MAG TPA: hypothetical protein PKN29_09590, partial [Candidatus Ozemobacteraceae bacterium]|nr:hypothetical protein [Candidatus Ozemobacteraceae bacterium]